MSFVYLALYQNRVRGIFFDERTEETSIFINFIPYTRESRILTKTFEPVIIHLAICILCDFNWIARRTRTHTQVQK